MLQHLGLADKKAPIDPGSIALRFFEKAYNFAINLGFERAKTAVGLYGRHRHGAAMTLVLGKQCLDIDVAYRIAICEKKWFPIQIFFGALDPASGQRIRARLQERNPPRFTGIVVHRHIVLREIDRNVALMQEIVREIFLDHIPAITKKDHKIVEAEPGIDFHNMPKYWPAADLNHGFGSYIGLFAEPRSFSARQYYDLHGTAPFTRQIKSFMRACHT